MVNLLRGLPSMLRSLPFAVTTATLAASANQAHSTLTTLTTDAPTAASTAAFPALAALADASDIAAVVHRGLRQASRSDQCQIVYERNHGRAARDVLLEAPRQRCV